MGREGVREGVTERASCSCCGCCIDVELVVEPAFSGPGVVEDDPRLLPGSVTVLISDMPAEDGAGDAADTGVSMDG